MNQTYDCNIILDLLPLSIDQMVCEETDQVIREHLLECESCRRIYEEMSKEIDITSEKKKRKRKHRYRKKNVIKMIILGYLLFLAMIIAFCVIDVKFFF